MLAAPRERGSSALAPVRSASYIAHIMFIETELTPNPATIKFLPGEAVMPSGTRDFPDAESAAASPLASALFDLGDVSGVFFGRDFVSVTAGEGVDWSALKPQVVAMLLDHFITGAPLFAGPDASGIVIPADDDQIADDPADAEVIEQIKELIEVRVRPAVANDGGDIVYRGFRDGVVYLTMQGACAGCPSSSATLKHGIESLLKHYVPEVLEVRAA
jgi:Fe-S cluster biogenesis protein NfuA